MEEQIWCIGSVVSYVECRICSESGVQLNT